MSTIKITKHSEAYWRVTFDIPPLNIFGPANIPQLEQAVSSIETDDRVKAMVTKAKIEIYTPHHLVVSEDYNTAVGADEIRSKATSNVKDGTVILFHEWRKETLEQMPAILKELRRQGCVFDTFSELRTYLDGKKPKSG